MKMASTYRSDLFAGQVALVSGGTSGIGAAIGDAFAAHGATVTVTGATTREVEAARGRPGFAAKEAVVLDVRDVAAVNALVGAMPRLDLLVNCAGTLRRGAEHDPATFDDVVDINLSGTMRLCAAARPKLAKNGGAIVNTASMLSFFGGGLVPGYSASKGGVAQLTKSLAIAYAAEKIRVNAIAPGWIATQLTAPLQEDAARNAAILGRTPMGRWGLPEDIAQVVLFLCSPAAAFVTGAIVPVDGGYLVA
ncbi:MAG: SDR family oxidoreductase [Betaproteobacteria bacterium]|jgi:NAD(P)-dependent dehydrogenase (short-subunit alcohol dehydrogenase family)|nr:SDR family oxidoreductase [Betaproteobacteria bacterium]MBK6600684.1 SDR family oxidoreductase [Betaproteobacteria bacterium]MBK7083099.1 SDR family oxidoreductase [Betaproteobacteria bacterium]MBK7745109.1 SDR family oxidoreductase [Betaproteobacteria bacterium]MBK8689768.1 SDR family oxidoreductase [Betaproteobacteria bacterium]